MIAHLICMLFGHDRSVSCAHRVDGVWRSRCKRCGENIIRVRRSKWRAESVASGRVD